MLYHKVGKSLLLLLPLCFASLSYAGPAADAVGACLANSTTGKDRVNLARWVFAAMTKHPEVSNISNLAPEKLEEINMTNGKLLTRLLSEDCRNEIKIATDLEDPAAIKSAFESLGRLAMLELMSNPAVGAEFTSGLSKYVDMKKIQEALK